MPLKWQISRIHYGFFSPVWCLRRLLSVTWTVRRSNQPILKEINPEYSLEELMLKLKLQSFGHLMQRARLTGKDPDAEKDWGQEEKGATEDEMAGWHHRLNGHEFEQSLGDSEGQVCLVCCSPWGCKEWDRTEWLSNDNRHWHNTVNQLYFNKVSFLKSHCLDKFGEMT